MATLNTLPQAELLARLSSIASHHGGIASMPDECTVAGTLTAIKAKWFLGGRKVTSNFTCTLDTASHEAHFRESAFETTWGMPPPTLTVQATSQYGTRAVRCLAINHPDAVILRELLLAEGRFPG